MKDYLRALVGEVVSKYDVDGIHLDYVRYPDNAMKFPDSDSFRKWGSRSKSLFRWREDNITGIVTAIYEEVKRLKPWVKVSSSPLGRYASLEGFLRNGAAWRLFRKIRKIGCRADGMILLSR